MADKRTLITKAAIKEGMLELLGKTPFNYVTVASLCREAGVGRATFYTHYTGIMDVVDELADDAINATERSHENAFTASSILAEKMRETTDPSVLEPYMKMLPVCQRVADNPKYNVLFKDPFVSEYIIMRIYNNERGESIKYLMENCHITAEQADKLFLFNITGAFEVNRAMGWKKNEAWYNVQKVLLTFIVGGTNALAKL